MSVQNPASPNPAPPAPPANPDPNPPNPNPNPPAPPADPNPPAPPANPDPPKFLGRFKDEAEANAYLEQVDKDREVLEKHKKFVEAVSPHLKVDENGKVVYTGPLPKTPDEEEAQRQKEEEEIRTRFQDDPISMSRELARKEGERVLQLRDAIGTQRESLKAKYAAIDEDFAEHFKLVEESMKAFPMEQQAAPNFWETGYRLILAHNLDKVFSKREAKLKKDWEANATMTKQNQEDPGGKGGPPADPAKGGGDQLTPAQKQVADAMGVTYDVYAQRLKEQEQDNNQYGR